jgi:hypothetical protein
MTKHERPQRPPIELPQPDTDFGDVPEFRRTARGTHDSVRSAVEPRYPSRVPGSQDRATSYEQSTLQPPRHRAYRHLGSKNRATVAVITTLALLGLGAAADSAVRSANRPYDIAAELTHPAKDVAKELTANGSQGVVMVPLEGDNTDAIADNIATPAAIEEVDEILYAQQGNTDAVSTHLAALPAGDLKASTLQGLPDGGKVTPVDLVALENGWDAASVVVQAVPSDNTQ